MPRKSKDTGKTKSKAKAKKNRGIVYVLINPSMEGYVKIGRTENIVQRLKQHDNTSVPLPFQCVYATELEDYKEVETTIHEIFDKDRVTDDYKRRKREFFEIDPQHAVSVLLLAQKGRAAKDVTPEEDITGSEKSRIALQETIEKRRKRFKFSMIGLKKGNVITYARDQRVKAKVHSDRTIIFKRKEVSIYEATMTLLEREGKNWKSVQGQLYWMYKDKKHGDETLTERRKRMEEE